MAQTAQPDTPLDESVFSAPSLVASWGGLHSDNILFYFASSPFFDRTSNNATIFNQAHFNPAGMGHIVATRAAFEARLRSMTGLEFIVAHDPTRSATTGHVLPTANTGCWTIRKQMRRNASSAPGSVEVLAEYFVVGDRVFQAPTVGAVLGTRLLSTARALLKLVGKAGECAVFEPARGHVYPPTTTASKSLADAGANAGSRSSTPVPASAATAAAASTTQADADEQTNYNDEDTSESLFAETLSNSLRWGATYMDEHPLVGEPGNFIIHTAPSETTTSSTERKGAALPTLSIKTDVAGALAKRDKIASGSAGGEKSPLSPTGTGATRKRKKDRAKTLTPRDGKTPAAPVGA